jgi:hypothetical protein
MGAHEGTGMSGTEKGHMSALVTTGVLKMVVLAVVAAAGGHKLPNI